ncbi:hypothetical protein [Chamaesiphon minutus]|uniref:hypothetical protein n=1 Tax=Chamaesiphon minutus TaxID=1173032 RepID=UPI0012F72CE4|nr:hypothetical protein [Chamaesiphon minutus]
MTSSLRGKSSYYFGGERRLAFLLSQTLRVGVASPLAKRRETRRFSETATQLPSGRLRQRPGGNLPVVCVKTRQGAGSGELGL